MPDTGIVAFVLSSSSRRDVLMELDGGAASSSTLVEATEASESAAYNAINALEDRGLIQDGDEGDWSLTGAGRLVIDQIRQCTNLDEVLDSHLEYWQTHDSAGLPEEFRREFDRLAGSEVITSPNNDPYRAARRVKTAMEDAEEELAGIVPIYDERRADAYLHSEADRCRLVMTPDIVERLLRDDPYQPDGTGAELNIRVAQAPIAMIVTESELVFSLPTCGGGYDTTTEVIAEHDDAIDWGHRLFEHYWSSAPDVERYVAEELSEFLEDMYSP